MRTPTLEESESALGLPTRRRRRGQGNAPAAGRRTHLSGRYTPPSRPRNVLGANLDAVPRWRVKNNRRGLRSHQDEARAWTGTDEQRERTTTDATEFVHHPARWDWFLDRERGQVFSRYPRLHDGPHGEPVLPRRYLKHVPPRPNGVVTALRAGLHRVHALLGVRP